jgi:signal transduction histidine kinase
MNVPVFSKGRIIGGLLLRSLKPYAYTDKDVRLAERIGNQIAGAIANAQLYAERIQAEQERAALQEQLRQSQKMEAIGKLAGGVAHDFNNLLTVIQGYGELILNSVDQNSPLRQDVQEIINASERASSLTRQLLAFSRKQVLQPKVLDLNTHVSNMDKMLRRMIGEDIELVTLLAENLGRIKADPGQIEQVILNLALNAKDAMLKGGKLTIETANVKLDESYAHSHIGVTPGHYVMLSVSDNGVGMTPEIKERIFEPFFTTKEKGKGTGLGLSTVYGIIQQSGGNVWVYSEPGVGTTFKIYLPVIEEGRDSIQSLAVSTKPLQGSETILLVEDEEMVRKLACTVLQKYGYTVLEAPNGEEALRIVQGQNGNPIHLMVTDVVMPGMSGRQLADRLGSLWPEMKVLYMSGYTDNAIVHHGVLDPGIAYIQKPFAPNALTSKVREILDGE